MKIFTNFHTMVLKHKELQERRQLLEDYKSLDEFIRRSQEITKKYQDKVEEITTR